MPTVYRARKHEVGDPPLFEETKNLIYKEKEKVTKFGRLNDVGESKFYTASDKDTTLLEVRPKLNDEITILESRLIDPKKAPELVEVGIRELMIQQNHSSEFIKQNTENLNKILKSRDSKMRYKMICDFLIKEMTKLVKDDETHKYKSTIAIGRFMTCLKQSIDGMVYPSVNRIGAECIVLKPESYDRYYRPDHCFKVKVVDVNSDGALVAECLDDSIEISENGKIIWKSQYQAKE